MASYNAQTTRTAIEKSSLDSRKSVLDNENDVVIIQWKALQLLKSDLNSKLGEIQGINDKINKALEQCVDLN